MTCVLNMLEVNPQYNMFLSLLNSPVGPTYRTHGKAMVGPLSRRRLGRGGVKLLLCAVQCNYAHGKGFAVPFFPTTRQSPFCRPERCRGALCRVHGTAKDLPCVFLALPCYRWDMAKNAFPIVTSVELEDDFLCVWSFAKVGLCLNRSPFLILNIFCLYCIVIYVVCVMHELTYCCCENNHACQYLLSSKGLDLSVNYDVDN